MFCDMEELTRGLQYLFETCVVRSLRATLRVLLGPWIRVRKTIFVGGGGWAGGQGTHAICCQLQRLTIWLSHRWLLRNKTKIVTAYETDVIRHLQTSASLRRRRGVRGPLRGSIGNTLPSLYWCCTLSYEEERQPRDRLQKQIKRKKMSFCGSTYASLTVPEVSNEDGWRRRPCKTEASAALQAGILYVPCCGCEGNTDELT